MNEPGWDLNSEDGLRAACAEVEQRIDPNRLARVTKFLAEVAAVPAAERASWEFQKRIWCENPIRWTKAYVGEETLEDEEAPEVVRRPHEHCSSCGLEGAG